MILEYPKVANEMFPGLPEMLVLKLHQFVVDLLPRLCPRLVSTYNTVCVCMTDIQPERGRPKKILSSKGFYPPLAIVQSYFCDLGSNRGLLLGFEIKERCFSSFGSDHGLVHFTPLYLFTGVPRIFERARRNHVSFETTFSDPAETESLRPNS